VAHPRTKLTVFGRQLLVARVEVLGWPVAHAAAMQGISRATGYKWLRRYRAEGDPGLLDRSSRPRRSPRALSTDQARAIVAARVERRWGPHRLAPLTGHPRSTVYAALRRAGLSRLHDTDRPTGIPIRYQACHPGALLHQDHKKLGRVPDGGGWRVLGRENTARLDRGRVGYDHFEVVVDDRSRVAFVVPVPDERPASAVRALELAATEFARLGVRVERVLTDNGGPYRSHAYAATLAELGVRHKRTRPYRPQTNGKAERFIKTMLGEWAYARPYRSNDERLAALAVWVDSYNHERTHTALAGQVPMDVLVSNVHGNHS
jgi:transposase InsO family protein